MPLVCTMTYTYEMRQAIVCTQRAPRWERKSKKITDGSVCEKYLDQAQPLLRIKWDSKCKNADIRESTLQSPVRVPAAVAGLGFYARLVHICNNRKHVWHRDIPDLRDVTTSQSLTQSVGRPRPQSTLRAGTCASGKHIVDDVRCHVRDAPSGLALWQAGVTRGIASPISRSSTPCSNARFSVLLGTSALRAHCRISRPFATPNRMASLTRRMTRCLIASVIGFRR
jgi:hypothetical protein